MKSLGVKSTDAPNRQQKEKKGKKFFVEIHSKQVGKRLANGWRTMELKRIIA
jgi:hypothetical protein